jgi:uncharacterized membrane protein YecN with MAPEG domain
MSDTDRSYDELSESARRRLAAASLLRSLVVSLAIFVGYFVLPMEHLDTNTVLQLTVGLVFVAALLAWQMYSIARSPYPRIRAVGALATTVPLFFAVFAATYYVMERTQPGSFTEPLTRLDSIYFVVTTFATVGFGDIAGVSEQARAIITVQMIGDLVIVGFVARAMLNAVQASLRRRRD